MKKSRIYRGTSVKNVDWRLLLGHEGEDAWVGLDVSKDHILAVLRWPSGQFERPWRVTNPEDLVVLVSCLKRVAAGRRLVVAMEPSGTYGDPLRQALGDAGIPVHRVSPKQAHDYAEVFDGVPSQHDGKDAAVVADLAAIGKCCPWPYREASEQDQEMAYWVDWMDAHQRQLVMWCGRVEALLGRHWPELKKVIRCSATTLLKALCQYGGPQQMAQDGDFSRRLRCWGGRLLREAKIARLVNLAASTQGVRQTRYDALRLSEYAKHALAAKRQVQLARRHLKRLAPGNPVLAAQAAAVGASTACVLWVHLGDPRDYSSGPAYRKAMGLNLKERSSGRWEGKLKITKRGPGQVRRWLYFAALRRAKDPAVRPWYEAKKARDASDARGAVTGIMRKLALALYQIGARGASFETWRLFPGGKKKKMGFRRHVRAKK
jgi:transposase